MIFGNWTFGASLWILKILTIFVLLVVVKLPSLELDSHSGKYRSRDCIVGVGTSSGMNCAGIEFRHEPRILSSPKYSRLVLGAHTASCTMGTGILPWR